MQGDNTEADIIAALKQIQSRMDEFDIVVMIRGGGSTTDLQAFDSEAIAREIALFPLPVIVGIGHLRDNTILDLVAARSVKTPTAAAEFILNNLFAYCFKYCCYSESFIFYLISCSQYRFNSGYSIVIITFNNHLSTV